MVYVEVGMMGTKQFAQDASGYVLIGDDRDIGVSSHQRNALWDWCKINTIDVEYQGTMMNTDVWRVKDEQQRLWFILRWT